jgi:hypothetical protein
MFVMTVIRAVRMAQLMVFLAGVGAGLLLPSTEGEAAEQRCNQLGANCVCARSLVTSRWVASSNSGFYYEADQNTGDSKLCSTLTADGRATVWTPNSGSLSVASGLNGQSVTQHSGLTFVVEPSSAVINSLSGRVGARYYFQLGPGYQSTLDGGCSNDKYIHIGQYFTANTNGFYWNGDGSGFGIKPSQVIGKWMRLELYVNNYQNPTSYEVYLKNVTDGTPEIARTNLPPGAGVAGSMMPGNTHPVHRYRAGSCSGSSKMMYVLMAHWPTNSGQRIGPAAEVEGGLAGGGGTPSAAPPATPTGLTVR